jgi:glycosyltransferase involved in cell wall biosynthesis
VPTRFLADLLGKILKIKSIEVIRSPYFQETLATDDSLYKKYLKNKVYLLFFGRLSPLKGAQVLADALPKVWEIHPDLFAVFIGEDRRLDKKTTVKAYIQEKCVNNLDKTLFLPLTPHEKLYPIIEHARLVVLPSFFDNSPNTLLEAMGFGKPVVGTYGSSMDEFIEDGVSGFLVQPGDPDALAEKICQAWSRPDLEKIGQKAKEALNSHSVEKVLPELLHFYRKHLQS